MKNSVECQFHLNSIKTFSHLSYWNQINRLSQTAYTTTTIPLRLIKMHHQQHLSFIRNVNKLSHHVLRLTPLTKIMSFDRKFPKLIFICLRWRKSLIHLMFFSLYFLFSRHEWHFSIRKVEKRECFSDSISFIRNYFDFQFGIT